MPSPVARTHAQSHSSAAVQATPFYDLYVSKRNAHRHSAIEDMSEAAAAATEGLDADESDGEEQPSPGSVL